MAKSKGRRPEVCILAAVKDGQLISEKYIIKDQDPASDHGVFLTDGAISKFKEKYGQEPEKIWKHMYDKKSAQKKSAVKRTPMSRNFKGMNLTEKSEEAEYNGWKGKIFPDSNKEDGLFVFVKHLSAQSKTPPPAARVKLKDVKLSNQS